MAETSNEQTPEWSPTMLLRGDMEHPKHSGRYLVGVDEESYAEALAEIDRQREEIESLRSELWKVAECIWQNVHSDDAKHWARGIMVTLRPSAPPSFAVETTGKDRIEHLEFVLRGFYWDQVDYIKRNHLGGMDNHWMRATRIALGILPDDPIPSENGLGDK